MEAGSCQETRQNQNPEPRSDSIGTEKALGSFMSSDYDLTLQRHSPLNPLPVSRRRWPWLLLFVILALAGAAGVYVWPEIATLMPALGHEASGGAMTAGDKETLPDLLATQQKGEEDLAALGRAVADQQEQLKTIVDQMAALTSKVEALQRAAPAPAPVPPPVAAAPIAQAAPKPKKPPARAPKPLGPISTGGAPLTVAPSDAAH
jgi:uncharacterized coiled-coil protein SlyX